MKKKTLTYIVLALLLMLGFSLFWNYKQYRDAKDQNETIKEKIIVEYVEKKDSLPSPKEEKVVGTTKVPIKSERNKVSENKTDSTTSSEIVTDVPDSVEVELTQKVYSDSTYTAYVSGYRPNLDSIFVRQKIITHTITETKILKEKKFRRWNVGLIGGYGYGFQSQTFEPFIGVGLTISLF